MKCFNCGDAASHQHHVVPRSLGGVATVPLCHACHGKAHGRAKGFRSTKELTAMALSRKKARGEVCGTSPYGYSPAKDGTLVERSDEMTVVAVVKHMRLMRMSFERIVETLHRRGFRSRSGASYGKTQVCRMARWKPVEPAGPADEYSAARAELATPQLSLFGGVR